MKLVETSNIVGTSRVLTNIERLDVIETAESLKVMSWADISFT